MRIGDAANQAGMTAKAIRYYERIGLLPEAPRTESGYRDYDARDVRILRFVQRARGLGFPLKDVRTLLTLYLDQDRASADVKRIALDHVAAIEYKIREMESVRRTLLHLVDACQGNERPDCPIIDDLAGKPDGAAGDTGNEAA